MVNFIYVALFVLGAPFFAYGIYYMVIGLVGYRKHNQFEVAPPTNRFAAVIAARNEGQVIGNLIDTLKKQNYPTELLDVYVLPNNCTDDTEAVALAHGAKVFHCTQDVRSKGAALEQFFDATFAENDIYDAFCVFDADNLVDPGFFGAMNNALCAGETIAQGYRDAKNPKDSWISGCQSIFYWTLNRFMNLARYSIGMSAALNGTGFMVAADVLRDGGFRTFSMTEDIEFTTQSIMKGRRVAWVPEALTYDEHPLTFETSWKQRKRWSTGTIQCFIHYSPLLWQAFKETKNWGCADMILYLSAPLVQVLTAIYSVCSFIILSLLFVNTQVWSDALTFAIIFSVGGIFISFLFTAMVVKLEHHQLKQVKNYSFFSFWFFFFSWIFINIVCVVKPIETWEPIEHTQSISMSQLELGK
ncbi:MAG: glycosyltransferase family 2 protein [Eubacterium aggregans]|uniref:glycosyltransferase family 2 protein n=1 Tax=Eubacterium aggregans TaxID=81409 RepID=UPI002B220F54|nr:glycosyltransferase family 2 protein [Eubacterium aggregans]MEA5074267.1 glycosyltransferase family 2 protein [Eubacterium aggregans]